jgi:hypothetical protein
MKSNPGCDPKSIKSDDDSANSLPLQTPLFFGNQIKTPQIPVLMCRQTYYLISNWKGLNRPPMVAHLGHFLRAPCSAMRTSTQARQIPQMHSVHAYDSLSNETF